MDEPPDGRGAEARQRRTLGVRFARSGKVYSFDPGSLAPVRGDWVVVETQRGQEVGEVVVEPHEVPAAHVPQPLRPVLRMASPEDLASREAWRAKERHAFEVGREKIERYRLPMRLVDAEYSFDGGRLTFYFTAPDRVDFRELVRDLAGTFHTRIDLRQLGSRDVARMVGGIGPCGRAACCASFLPEFRPVTVRMAKEQGLALNPDKLSGLCGRLMCCLTYELEAAAHGVPAAADGSDQDAQADHGGADPEAQGVPATGQAPCCASCPAAGDGAKPPEAPRQSRPRRRRRHRRTSAA